MNDLDQQFADFFTAVDDTHKDFVDTAHKMVLQEGYKVKKVAPTKTYLFSVAYAHPKTRRGIINFMLRKKGLRTIISVRNCDKLSDTFLTLPPKMIEQLDKTNACINMETPGKCMAKCSGYDFYIGETHYQKCKFGCFQFDVDEESIPFLLELLKRELEERRIE